MAALRQPLNSDGRKQISSLHQFNSAHSVLNSAHSVLNSAHSALNSALDRNITSALDRNITSALDRNITNNSQEGYSLEGTGKMLPSSLLREEVPIKPQIGL